MFKIYLILYCIEESNSELDPHESVLPIDQRDLLGAVSDSSFSWSGISLSVLTNTPEQIWGQCVAELRDGSKGS